MTHQEKSIRLCGEGADAPVVPLAEDDVHLWSLPLDKDVAPLVPLMSLLSADELERASKYRLARDRDWFIAGRAALRCLLGRYLCMPAAEVPIGLTAHGKPYVKTGTGVPLLRFNIAHCGARALMAFSLGREIGVDIERENSGVDIEGVASIFLSPREHRDLEQAPASSRQEAFFRYWTCKEAFMKAVGLGMSLGPTDFSISASGSPVCLLECPADETRKWLFRHVVMANGWHAAIAVEESGRPVGFKSFELVGGIVDAIGGT